MITLELAQRLRAAGLAWHPAPGDQFAIPQPDLAGEVFTLSEMTIEAHTYPGGTVLGFNGTTEWALDSVLIDETVWLPREDQLRDLLGAAFRALHATDAGFEVEAVLPEASGRHLRLFVDTDAACAYGQALVALIEAVTEPPAASGEPTVES